MRKTVIAVVAALAVASLAPMVAAAAGAEASYCDGQLTIASAPCAPYRVFGEQPDGTYAVVARGSLSESGTACLGLPAKGPLGNGQPQFRIGVMVGGDPVWVSIPDEEAGWGWD